MILIEFINSKEKVMWLYTDGTFYSRFKPKHFYKNKISQNSPSFSSVSVNVTHNVLPLAAEINDKPGCIWRAIAFAHADTHLKWFASAKLALLNYTRICINHLCEC